MTSQEGLSLELRSVSRQDAGTYVCTANNGVGEEASAEIQVEIQCKKQQDGCLFRPKSIISKITLA